MNCRAAALCVAVLAASVAAPAMIEAIDRQMENPCH
jgi:hypothetical protein